MLFNHVSAGIPQIKAEISVKHSQAQGRSSLNSRRGNCVLLRVSRVTRLKEIFIIRMCNDNTQMLRKLGAVRQYALTAVIRRKLESKLNSWNVILQNRLRICACCSCDAWKILNYNFIVPSFRFSQPRLWTLRNVMPCSAVVCPNDQPLGCCNLYN